MNRPGTVTWLQVVNEMHPAFERRLAAFLTRSRLIEPGEATSMWIPHGVSPAGVAWLLHDWLDGYDIEVTTRMIKVIKK